MLADIRIRPSVKRALLHTCHKVGHEPVAESVALLHQGVKVAVVELKASALGLRRPDANVLWFDPSASKRWIDALTSGSTPILPDDPTPTNRAPVLGSIARWRLA